MISHIEEALSYRTASEQDALQIAELLTELGHPNRQEEIERRWSEWISFPGNEVLFAILQGEVVGLAVLGRTPSLYRPFPLGRLWAFIITERYRNRGLGREFLREIEGRFRDEGCGLIELTSNVIRSEAHRFYLQLGYEKSSFRFAKKLGLAKV